MTVQPKVIIYYDTDERNFNVKGENIIVDGRPLTMMFAVATGRGYQKAWRTVGMGIAKWFCLNVEDLLRNYRPDDLQSSSMVYTVGTELERKPHVVEKDYQMLMLEGVRLGEKEIVDNHATIQKTDA